MLMVIIDLHTYILSSDYIHVSLGYMGQLPTDLHAAMRQSSVARHWNRKCLHLATLGDTNQQLQIWVDPMIACIVYK